KHVSGDGESVARNMPVPTDAFRPGMCSYAAARVQDVDLTVVAPVVAGNEFVDDRIRRLALAQKPQTFGTVKRINKRLRSDRADACCDEWHPGTGCKKLRCNGNAETAGGLIAGNDRPGHVRPSQS